MKITCNQANDTLMVVLKKAQVAGSDEEKHRIILDHHTHGDLVPLEILDASRRVTEAGRVDFKATG
jgi:16S rRNA U516 pseudouridylate synthase RsuA-like enzyme